LIKLYGKRRHRVIIFQLPGGSYPERIAALKKSQKIMIHRVDSPRKRPAGPSPFGSDEDLPNLPMTSSYRIV